MLLPFQLELNNWSEPRGSDTAGQLPASHRELNSSVGTSKRCAVNCRGCWGPLQHLLSYWTSNRTGRWTLSLVELLNGEEAGNTNNSSPLAAERPAGGNKDGVELRGTTHKETNCSVCSCWPSSPAAEVYTSLFHVFSSFMSVELPAVAALSTWVLSDVHWFSSWT